MTMGYDSADGFYEVALDSSGAGLLFLPRSSLLPRYEVRSASSVPRTMHFPPPATLALRQIILMELEKAELNKYMATVEGWDTESRRYEVCLLADKRTLKLQPKNVLLPAGARVCVDGLQGATQHNGVLGKVRDFDCDSGRYEIEYVKEDGELGVLKLKRENALLYTAPKLEPVEADE